MGLCAEQIYFYKDIYNEVESSIINNSELDIRKTVQQLISLISSDKFIPLLCLELGSAVIFKDIIAMYEMKEKFLSLKIIFPLCEEIKKNNSFAELYKLSGLLGGDGNKFAENIYNQYIENNKDSIENFKKSEEGIKALNNIFI